MTTRNDDTTSHARVDRTAHPEESPHHVLHLGPTPRPKESHARQQRAILPITPLSSRKEIRYGATFLGATRSTPLASRKESTHASNARYPDHRTPRPEESRNTRLMDKREGSVKPTLTYMEGPVGLISLRNQPNLNPNGLIHVNSGLTEPKGNPDSNLTIRH